MQIVEFNSTRWLDLKSLENEEWFWIPEFEGAYMFSNYGRIKSIKRKGNNKDRIKKCRISKSGYVYTNIQYNGKKIVVKPHRLIGVYLIPNPLNKSQINHKDCNKLNNHISNLEWVTASENVQYCFTVGGKVPWNKGLTGSDTHINKHILQYDLNGNFIKEWDCILTAARYYNITSTHLIRVCQGVKKTGAGFIWRYKKEGDNCETSIKL